jgi:hypothetical protein
MISIAGDKQMLLNNHVKEVITDLVYIPVGAEKGDCPHCYVGVLRREEEVQDVFHCREGYICANCGAIFLEKQPRYYGRVAVWKNHN